MIVGFITTYAIIALQFESRSGEVYMYLIQHYVIKVFSYLRKVFSGYSGFLHP